MSTGAAAPPSPIETAIPHTKHTPGETCRATKTVRTLYPTGTEPGTSQLLHNVQTDSAHLFSEIHDPECDISFRLQLLGPLLLPSKPGITCEASPPKPSNPRAHKKRMLTPRAWVGVAWGGTWPLPVVQRLRRRPPVPAALDSSRPTLRPVPRSCLTADRTHGPAERERAGDHRGKGAPSSCRVPPVNHSFEHPKWSKEQFPPKKKIIFDHFWTHR